MWDEPLSVIMNRTGPMDVWRAHADMQAAVK